jgi:hypothetical protein
MLTIHPFVLIYLPWIFLLELFDSFIKKTISNLVILLTAFIIPILIFEILYRTNFLYIGSYSLTGSYLKDIFHHSKGATDSKILSFPNDINSIFTSTLNIVSFESIFSLIFFIIALRDLVTKFSKSLSIFSYVFYFLILSSIFIFFYNFKAQRILILLYIFYLFIVSYGVKLLFIKSKKICIIMLLFYIVWQISALSIYNSTTVGIKNIAEYIKQNKIKNVCAGDLYISKFEISDCALIAAIAGEEVIDLENPDYYVLFDRSYYLYGKPEKIEKFQKNIEPLKLIHSEPNNRYFTRPFLSQGSWTLLPFWIFSLYPKSMKDCIFFNKLVLFKK